MKKFKLQYISDIHLEHRTTLPHIAPKTKYLALIGDIGHPNKPLYSDFLRFTSKNWDKVLLVSGNHEYEQTRKYTKQDIDNMIMNLTNRYNNIYYLNNSTAMLDDHLVLGSTLWCNHPKNPKIVDEHNICLDWLKNELNNTSNNQNKIVLTHYLPSYKLIAPQYQTSKYKPFQNRFATDLDYLIKHPIQAWLCGHSHCQLQIYINNVYCGINCLGRPNEYNNTKNIIRILEL